MFVIEIFYLFYEKNYFLFHKSLIIVAVTLISGNREDTESKKKLALKLLALKVTAFLKWNLNILEKK